MTCGERGRRTVSGSPRPPWGGPPLLHREQTLLCGAAGCPVACAVFVTQDSRWCEAVTNPSLGQDPGGRPPGEEGGSPGWAGVSPRRCGLRPPGGGRWHQGQGGPHSVWVCSRQGPPFPQLGHEHLFSPPGGGLSLEAVVWHLLPTCLLLALGVLRRDPR